VQHIYKDVYIDSNGELYMVEKDFLSKNPKITNLTKLIDEKTLAKETPKNEVNKDANSA